MHVGIAPEEGNFYGEYIWIMKYLLHSPQFWIKCFRRMDLDYLEVAWWNNICNWKQRHRELPTGPHDLLGGVTFEEEVIVTLEVILYVTRAICVVNRLRIDVHVTLGIC